MFVPGETKIWGKSKGLDLLVQFYLGVVWKFEDDVEG